VKQDASRAAAGRGQVDDAPKGAPGTARGRCRRVAHRPNPSPTCPPPATTVRRSTNPRSHTLRRSTTDRRAAHRRHQLRFRLKPDLEKTGEPNA
jgi:hypothetical protein